MSGLGMAVGGASTTFRGGRRNNLNIAILGGGIAGLSAGRELRRRGRGVEIFERSTEYGGMARSFRWHGFDCDLGPHRLFCDDPVTLAEIAQRTSLTEHQRRSRIRMQGRWLREPINGAEVLGKLHPRDSMRIAHGYLRRPDMEGTNFDEVVHARFGEGLRDVFFRPYAQKLFGVDPTEISAEWANQKIRVGGLREYIRQNSRLSSRTFLYPSEGGYGAIVDALYQDVRSCVFTDYTLVRIGFARSGGVICVFERSCGSRLIRHFDQVISTLPATVLGRLLGSEPALRFRPVTLHYLLVAQEQVTRNHWLYFADGTDRHRINRVTEFKNFASTPDPRPVTVLCCEVTHSASVTTGEVVAELAGVGLLDAGDVIDTKVVTLANAYAIHDRSTIEELFEFDRFVAKFPQIHRLGRTSTFAHQDLDEVISGSRLLAEQLSPRRLPAGQLSPRRPIDLVAA